MDPNHPKDYHHSINFPFNFLDLSENSPPFQNYQLHHPNPNAPTGSYFQGLESNPSAPYFSQNQGYMNPSELTNSSHSQMFTTPSPNTPGASSTSQMHQGNTQEEATSLDEIQPTPEDGTLAQATRGRGGRARGRGGRAARGRSGRLSTGERVKWGQSKELLLVSAWINISTDPISTTNSTLTAFWERVAEYYNMYRGDGVERIASTCKARWHKMSPDVSKFVGAYEQAANLQSSGQSQVDVLKKAHEIFLQDMKYDFVFEHAWRELRNEPKWRSMYKAASASTGGSSKRSKLNEDGSYSTSGGSTPTSAPPRPIGQKAAKAAANKGKKVVGSSTDSIKQIEEVYNKLMENREARGKKKSEEIGKQEKIASDYLRASNMSALGVLLAKSELTPEEEMIKKMLIAELFPSN